MSRAVLSALLLLLVCAVSTALVQAHEVRPAYLRIQQADDDRYDVMWRVPARGELRLGIYVQLPANCEAPEAREESCIRMSTFKFAEIQEFNRDFACMILIFPGFSRDGAT